MNNPNPSAVLVTEEGRSWRLDGYIEHDGHEWWRIAEGPRVLVDAESVEVVESSKLRAVEAELGRRLDLTTEERTVLWVLLRMQEKPATPEVREALESIEAKLAALASSPGREAGQEGGTDETADGNEGG